MSVDNCFSVRPQVRITIYHYNSLLRPSYQISSAWPSSRANKMLQAIAAETSGVPAADEEREYFCGEHLPHQSRGRHKLW